MDSLGDDLQLAGLRELVLAQLFGPAWAADDVPLVLDRYRAGDPRAALARLFVLGETVDGGSLPVPAERLADAGLVDVVADRARPRMRLTPVDGLLVAHDGPSADADVVTGVSAASRTLAALTVRRPVERALDVGTGSGVQAMLAARHARRVVATDVNQRALELARIGSRLNGLPLDLREGSLLDPVGGERFDLIVANPPFVISPDSDFVFRDSGLPGDAICRDVVRGAAAHLRPGGHATVLCNWVCRSAEERWQPLVEWVDGLACDSLLICHGAIDPLRYAARWNEPIRGDGARYAAAVGRWLDYYEEQGIVAIGIGAVVLRGGDRPGWVRGFTAPRPATGAAGDHLLRLFAAGDALDRSSDLLDERLALVRGHRLEQTLVYGDEYGVADVTMSLAEGVGLVGQLDPEAVALLFALRPDRSVREAAAEADVPEAAAQATVRQLFERGLLDLVSASSR